VREPGENQKVHSRLQGLDAEVNIPSASSRGGIISLDIAFYRTALRLLRPNPEIGSEASVARTRFVDSAALCFQYGTNRGPSEQVRATLAATEPAKSPNTGPRFVLPSITPIFVIRAPPTGVQPDALAKNTEPAGRSAIIPRGANATSESPEPAKASTIANLECHTCLPE